MSSRILAGALALVLGLSLWFARAAQDDLFSPTTGTVSGLQLTNNYNAAFASLASCNSGTSAPANLSGGPVAGQCWLDTTSTPYAMKKYDGTSWVVTGYIDTSNHQWFPVNGGGATTLASAATVDLCSVPQSLITISGVVTITSFGASCPIGAERTLVFAGSLTLTHNGTTMILNKAAGNITTAAGDMARVVALGSSNYRVIYNAVSGQALVNPAVPVGTILYGTWITAPSASYELAAGQSLARASYPEFFAASAPTYTVSRTSGSPTLTGFSSTIGLGAGQKVEGTGIPAGATILSIGSTTVTLASTCGGGAAACNASSSGSGQVQIILYGAADTSSFNAPDCRGNVMAGIGSLGGTDAARLTAVYFGLAGTRAGAMSGSESQTLTEPQLPAVSHAATRTQDVAVGLTFNTTAAFGAGGTAAVTNILGTGGTFPVTANIPQQPTFAFTFGSGDPHRTVQPTLVTGCIVRAQP